MSAEYPTVDDLLTLANNLKYEGHTSRAEVVANTANLLAVRDERIKKLEGLLKRIDESGICPICRGQVWTVMAVAGSSRTRRVIEHAPGCELAAVLKEGEE